MPFYLPKEIYSSVEDIDYDGLWQKGIRYLIFDIDETLIPRDEHIITPSLLAFVENLKAKGFELFLLSNSRHPLRVKDFARILDAPYGFLSFKPLPFGFWRALEQMRAPANRTAMIGDQLFMDVIGGNWAGLYTVYVRPKTPEIYFPRQMMRDAENWILGRSFPED